MGHLVNLDFPTFISFCLGKNGVPSSGFLVSSGNVTQSKSNYIKNLHKHLSKTYYTHKRKKCTQAYFVTL